MTDNLSESTTAADASPFNQWKEREKLEAKAIGFNKANIIEALKRAGISKIVIEFDGSCDDGGIETIACEGNDGKIPEVTINEWRPGQCNTLVGEETALATAIELRLRPSSAHQFRLGKRCRRLRRYHDRRLSRNRHAYAQHPLRRHLNHHPQLLRASR